MAWVTGPHAAAPQGVICYAAEAPGEVSWDDEAAAAAAELAAEREKAIAESEPEPQHPDRPDHSA